MNIFDKIEQQFSKKMPFVVYNKPDSGELIAVFQKNKELYFANDFTEKGFIFTSFDGEKNILIPENQSNVFVEKCNFLEENKISNPDFVINNNDQQAHEILVKKAIKTIKKSNFSKVVLSRKETFNLETFDLVSVFKKLLNAYPNAFSYCWFHPKIGLWLGAFSEQLLRVKGDIFYTMAVAGTQKCNGSEEIIWQKKEKEEQQFVTDFIIDELQNTVSKIEISEPHTLKAGNLLHIKTDIKGVLNSDSSLKKTIEILHPTPAVCGFPKEITKKFILENENYDRAFYAGFLGELNLDFGSKENNTDLFVNLRCMQVEIASKPKMTKAHLYVGGGITKDSIPENEWIETVNKTTTMRKIIG